MVPLTSLRAGAFERDGSAMSPGTCFEPWNIMCSNRCAKPVRPGSSFAGPTWYQMFTATSGSRWSSDRITSRPLGSVYFSNAIFGTSVCRDVAAGAWA